MSYHPTHTNENEEGRAGWGKTNGETQSNGITRSMSGFAVMRAEDELIYDGDGRPSGFRRKTTTRQEVPHVRRVKVPVLVKKIVEAVVQKQVPISKQVEVADFEEVEEKYTIFREEKAQRAKKVWVEKTVEEEFVKKVPVTRSRVVKKPITRIEEVDDFQMVTLPSTKVVEVEGFRIDEVEDRKMVEVEEWEVYELLPQQTGEIIKGEERDLGPMESFQPYRKVGTQVITKDDAPSFGIDLENIETDHDAGKVSTMAPVVTRVGDRLGYSSAAGASFSPGADHRMPVSPAPSTSHHSHYSSPPSNQSTPGHPAPTTTSASGYHPLVASSLVSRGPPSAGPGSSARPPPASRQATSRNEDDYGLDRF